MRGYWISQNFWWLPYTQEDQAKRARRRLCWVFYLHLLHLPYTARAAAHGLVAAPFAG
jgi:hypothetical protein